MDTFRGYVDPGVFPQHARVRRRHGRCSFKNAPIILFCACTAGLGTLQFQNVSQFLLLHAYVYSNTMVCSILRVSYCLLAFKRRSVYCLVWVGRWRASLRNALQLPIPVPHYFESNERRSTKVQDSD